MSHTVDPARAAMKPLPTGWLGVAAALWYLAFVELLALAAAGSLPLSTMRLAKPVFALGICVWVWLCTQPVAAWGGRGGGRWFALGLVTMWGLFLATTGAAYALHVGGGGPLTELPAVMTAATFNGYKLGFLGTLLLSGWLASRSPLPGAPALEREAEQQRLLAALDSR